MRDLESSVEAFLDATDDCFAEYENGYTDADATLRRLEKHIEELRSATE